MSVNADEQESTDYESVDGDEEEQCTSPPTPPPRPPHMYFPSAQGILTRQDDPDLPDNVTTLTTEDGCKVYLVGTAHFSTESQQDVIKTIQTVRPDVVVLELCKGRVNILQLDEETLMKEAKNIDLNKFRSAVKQSGFLQGAMHLLLLTMSAHLTEQLGMAPGGEFRAAYQQAQKIPGCRIHLGDRPIQITLKRALGSLNGWQKLRLAWHILTSKEPISKEDVERCKNRDLLEEMLREMTGEFPALSQVFVTERDLFLAKTLRLLAKPVTSPITGQVPSVVVGVVGIGHTPGIISHWDTVQHVDISPLLTTPKPSAFSITMKWTVRAALVSLLAWAGYRTVRWTIPRLPNNPFS